jgi:hypothetical protein
VVTEAIFTCGRWTPIWTNAMTLSNELLPAPRTSQRDSRIDLLRGLALVTIFIDHVPDNPLTMATMRNFGFADAAELFVVLAGVSSMLAYGRAFEREGPLAGLRRVWQRCGRIYAYQVGLLVMMIAIAHQWRSVFGHQSEPLAIFFKEPATALAHAMTLQALPASLNILPLYIVLLGAFPLIYAGVRFAPWFTLAASGGLWLVANLDDNFNLTNWLDGQGWFFNPFAWQFLFTLGAFGARALRRWSGAFPRRWWLLAGCSGYLAAGVLIAAPWVAWDLSDWQPILLDPSDKTNLAPERLVNILAVIYLALSSPLLLRLSRQAWLGPLVACGKHSLEVFSFATLSALVFRLLFSEFGATLGLQVTVNVVGIGTMMLLALWLERHKLAAAHARRPQPAAATAVR